MRCLKLYLKFQTHKKTKTICCNKRTMHMYTTEDEDGWCFYATDKETMHEYTNSMLH
jgi:hypothetical protein